MAPALTGLGRVFINARGVGEKYIYHSFMKVDGLDKSLGDVTPIYLPNPEQYDDFIEVATIKGADSRASSTLTAYLPINTTSPLEEIERQGCSFDIQVHYGQCTRPDSFNEFESAIIMKNVRLTSYGLTTLTARTPDERAIVDETASISVGKFYRILPVKQSRIPVTFFPNNAFSFGITNVGIKSCGDNCAGRSTGCDTWIMGVKNANNSISFAYTTDCGVSWTLTSANAPTAHNTTVQAINMYAYGGYIYFATVQTSITSFYRTSIASILAGSADTVSIMPNANTTFMFEIKASQNYIWFVGQRGTNVSTIRAYSPTTGLYQDFTNDTETFRAIDVLSDDIVVVGGMTGVIYYSNSFGAFTEVTTKPTTTGTVTGIKVFSATRWLIGTSVGYFLTTNAGLSWTKVLDAANWARLSFYDDIVGYANSTLGTYRTLDAGVTWQKIASDITYNTNDLLVCEHNPNIYMVAGGDTGGGYLYKGNP